MKGNASTCSGQKKNDVMEEKKYRYAPWQNPDLKLLQTVKVFSVHLLWKNTPTSWLEFEPRELVMQGRISSTVCSVCCFIGLGLKEEDSLRKWRTMISQLKFDSLCSVLYCLKHSPMIT